MNDPQNDFSNDGECPICGGYALIAGNGDDMSASCEGDCGTFAVTPDEDGQLIPVPQPDSDPVAFSDGDPF